MKQIENLKILLLEKRTQLINQLDHLQQSSIDMGKSAIKEYILKKRKQLIKIDQTLNLINQKKVERTSKKSQQSSPLN